MNQDVRQDSLTVLAKAQDALEERDEAMFSKISNETIHNASIYQDDVSLDLAVVMYALSKMVARKEMTSAVSDNMGKLFEKCIQALKQEKSQAYHDVIHVMLEEIKKVDKAISSYVMDVLDQARLKKSAKLYDHGISLAQSASKLGVSQWELLSYVGKTLMNDGEGSSVVNMRKRLAYTRTLFGK